MQQIYCVSLSHCTAITKYTTFIKTIEMPINITSQNHLKNSQHVKFNIETISEQKNFDHNLNYDAKTFRGKIHTTPTKIIKRKRRFQKEKKKEKKKRKEKKEKKKKKIV
jgi:hypothetical protein